MDNKVYPEHFDIIVLNDNLEEYKASRAASEQIFNWVS